MADQTVNSGPVLAADGSPLKKSLARALFRSKLRALGLIAPLLIFVLISFIWPIYSMLSRSVENHIVSEILPETAAIIHTWDATTGELPSDEVFDAFTRDLIVAVNAKQHTKLELG